ncbi:hypothetical protein GOP47_0027245 [Adiantum capillus-veneris]|nr:hypothetical protein GOP47_0027245 [Adiantum capillus-veneris]
MAPDRIDPCKLQGKECMCHVCECGMHKCPTLHTSSNVHYSKDLGSEYSGRYVKWPKQDRVKPKVAILGKDAPPFVGVTTNKVDYCPKRIPNRTPIKHGAQKTLDHCIPDGNYNNVTTEYGENYKKKPFQQRTPVKPHSTKFGDNAKFDDTTTNHTDYKAWPLHPRAPMKPPSTCLDSRSKLDDTTTYSINYWDKSKALPRPSPRKHEPTAASNAPFSSETTHHHDFGPKPLPKRCPSVRHDTDNVGDPNQHAFVGESTYHDNYKAWPVRANRRGDPLKCNLSPPADAKFSGETNYNNDFKAPKLPKRCPVLYRPRPQKVEGDHFIYAEA